MYRSPNYRRRERIALVIVVAIVFVLVVSGAFSFMWENSNRQANIINNMPAFEQMGNVWTGMGFVDNSAFQTTWSLQGRTMSAWGVLTSSLDMYYVFLYFTTGVIGCTFIAVILLCMLFSLLAKRNRGNQYIFLSLFFSLLFYGFWESIWFSYRFWPMLILIALLWIVVSGQGQREERV